MEDAGINTWLLAAAICLAIGAGSLIWPCLWRACQWRWLGNVNHGQDGGVGLYQCTRCKCCSIGAFRSIAPWNEAGSGGNVPNFKEGPPA